MCVTISRFSVQRLRVCLFNFFTRGIDLDVFRKTLKDLQGRVRSIIIVKRTKDCSCNVMSVCQLSVLAEHSVPNVCVFVFFCFLVGICDSVGWVGGLNDTGDMIIYCRLYNACVLMSLACACASNALFIVGFSDLSQETHFWLKFYCIWLS